MRVALKSNSGVRVEELKERLRQDLPTRLQEWFAKRLQAEGMTTERAAERVRGLRVSFEPADIVNQVMSFGSPTPVEVAINGPNLAETGAYAEKVREQLAQVPSLRDVQIAQPLDYPTVAVKLDRERAGASGATAADVARSLVSATSSSRFVVPNYWADPKTGIGYQVQVEIPPVRMDSAAKVGEVPVKTDAHGRGEATSPLLLRDVARVGQGTMPGEYDRNNMKRLLSVTANVQGEDLGRVADRVTQALAEAGAPPKGATVEVRGQITPMRQMFNGLGIGLGLAVVVIFLLLTAYFQSLRLAFVAITTVPAVIAGVTAALLATGTTLNIQSFMGAIMAVGVGVANAILLVTFAEKARREGADARRAAVEGARHRLRPILMTSCAMIAGMTPMALGLGEAGDQVAPLGRAVIGGLAAGTLATLVILPSVFAIVQGWAGRRSPSLDPDDPESIHAHRDESTNATPDPVAAT